MENHPLLDSSPSTEGESEVQSLLKGGFAAGALTIFMSFLPILHNLPVFGIDAAKNWLWSVDLSPGFLGQGIITGPVIPLHMLAGTIVGWGILSPYAKNKGYAPGEVDDWENGPRGWIIWISLSALLADAFVKLSWLLVSPFWFAWLQRFRSSQSSSSTFEPVPHPASAYDTFGTTRRTGVALAASPETKSFVTTKLLSISFLASVSVCLLAMGWTFGSITPWYYTLLSILLSIPMAVVGIRSLAETDYNPESALVSQLVFAQLISPSNPNGIIINLIAAATAQAGANQAGDLSYDLKVGSLVGAHPEAQTLGQVIGSLIGAVISCGIYKFYAARNPIPGPIFRIPSSFLVLSTARLLMGQGLPTGVTPFVVGTAIVFTVLTIIKMRYTNQWWDKFIPSGVAFAIGIAQISNRSRAVLTRP
ncbi:OPT super [Fusarium equiseti]|uniref:OPT super n=1 Tax=Fusarium equiseti TaxID=61235 RepID=A0ABQ8RH11_FUSEQ|nr:OPT super [Fusarium equiseti]